MLAGAVAATLVLLYVGARETPIFAVRTVEISGGSADVRRAVRVAAEPVEGKSLVALDGAGLVRDLEALPSVRSAGYDRPLAVVQLENERWIVSDRGRIIGAAPPGTKSGLPQFNLAARPGLAPGSFLTDPLGHIVLEALALVPKGFPARIYSARLESGELTLVLRAPWGRPQLRLGEPVDVGVKLAAAALVIRSLSADERGSVGYVDASLPERVVVGWTAR